MSEKKRNKGGRNPKLDPAVFRYTVRFSEEEHNRFLSMFEKSGVYAKSVYNQVVKELRLHFSEKKAMALLYKLEQQTVELVKLSRQIVELSKEMQEKWSQKSA